MEKKNLTLFFPQDTHGRILLGRKQRGFGEGKWNGFGGKQESGERLCDTAVRELYEEALLTASSDMLTEAARLTFVYSDTNDVHEVTAYTLTVEDAEAPAHTEEMYCAWFRVVEIPYEQMWVDDQYWLPQVLKGKYVNARFVFKDHDTIIEKEITVEERS